MESMHRVFVYGTLKRGYRNHHLLAHSVLIGRAYTASPYCMLDGEYPVLRDLGEDLSPVAGEIYEVDPQTLSALDELEGVAEGLYDRVEIDVVQIAEGRQGERKGRAFIYVGCAAHWDALGLSACVARDTKGHIDWPHPAKSSP